jgi:hypothetical protein
MEEGETSNLNYNLLYCIYLPTSIYYSLIVTNDFTSNLIFFTALITLTSVFKRNHLNVLIFQGVVTLADAAIKTLSSLSVIAVSSDIAVLDDRIVRSMIGLSVEAVSIPSIAYTVMLLISWILPFVYQ